MNEGLGILIGVSKPDQVIFESKRPVSIGEYVTMNYGRGKVLGLVERSSISSDALGNNIRNYEEAYESKEVAAENRRDKSYKGYVHILGYLDELKKCKAYCRLPPSRARSIRSIAADLPDRDICAIRRAVDKDWDPLAQPEVDARGKRGHRSFRATWLCLR